MVDIIAIVIPVISLIISFGVAMKNYVDTRRDFAIFDIVGFSESIFQYGEFPNYVWKVPISVLNRNVYLRKWSLFIDDVCVDSKSCNSLYSANGVALYIDLDWHLISYDTDSKIAISFRCGRGLYRFSRRLEFASRLHMLAEDAPVLQFSGLVRM